MLREINTLSRWMTEASLQNWRWLSDVVIGWLLFAVEVLSFHFSKSYSGVFVRFPRVAFLVQTLNFRSEVKCKDLWKQRIEKLLHLLKYPYLLGICISGKMMCYLVDDFFLLRDTHWDRLFRKQVDFSQIRQRNWYICLVIWNAE